MWPGILGFEDTVIPQLERALIAGHDVVLLGERGQGKTRLLRALIGLLDEWTPVIAGSELGEHPYSPITPESIRRAADSGDDLPITWRHRSERYTEKLATPDTSVADLVGDIDPIKVAEGRSLGDPETIAYGLIPRAHRGIVAVNELPDLAERIQVAMLNVMEERDIQVRGYTLRLPLDVLVVASANPEDYTNRGRIITPLKDRYGSQIRTHYPETIELEMEIMEQERTHFATDGIEVQVPEFMREIIAEMTHLARRSHDVSQRSGVSVRMSIANYENVMSNATKRAIRLKEKQAIPRISDLHAVIASTTGKIELEALGEVQEDRIVEKLMQGAVLATFNRYFSVRDFEDLVLAFENGLTVETSDMMPAMHYVHQVSHMDGLREAAGKLGVSGNPAAIASAVEFVLEGLHLNRRLNKDHGTSRAGVRYRG